MDSCVRRITTSRQLRALCNEWLKLFGLQDWVVACEFKPRSSEELGGADGANYPINERKVAWIWVARPSEIHPDEIEVTLVHEILHLFFAALPARSAELQRLTEEQAVDRLATVLVALRR